MVILDTMIIYPASYVTLSCIVVAVALLAEHCVEGGWFFVDPIYSAAS